MAGRMKDKKWQKQVDKGVVMDKPDYFYFQQSRELNRTTNLQINPHQPHQQVQG